MIASWMLYTAAVGALMTIAALALDRAFAARGRATRGIWAAAIALSLVVPAVDAIPRRWFQRAPTSRVLPFAITVAAPDAMVINRTKGLASSYAPHAGEPFPPRTLLFESHPLYCS